MLRKLFFFLTLTLATNIASADDKDVESSYQRGYTAWSEGDIVNAMPPLRVAADGGHAKAQALLGALLDHADNDLEAAKYFKMAAEQGDPDGALGLANFYLTGDTGDKDPQKARPLLQMAAEKGHLASMSTLAYALLGDQFGSDPGTRFSADTWKLVRQLAEKEELDFMAILEEAYRHGNPQVPQDVNAADALKAKVDKALGLDKVKKKRRRR